MWNALSRGIAAGTRQLSEAVGPLLEEDEDVIGDADADVAGGDDWSGGEPGDGGTGIAVINSLFGFGRDSPSPGGGGEGGTADGALASMENAPQAHPTAVGGVSTQNVLPGATGNVVSGPGPAPADHQQDGHVSSPVDEEPVVSAAPRSEEPHHAARQDPENPEVTEPLPPSLPPSTKSSGATTPPLPASAPAAPASAGDGASASSRSAREALSGMSAPAGRRNSGRMIEMSAREARLQQQRLIDAQRAINNLQRQLEANDEQQATIMNEYQRLIRERDEACQTLEARVRALEAELQSTKNRAAEAMSVAEDMDALRTVNASLKQAVISEVAAANRAAEERVAALRKLANATGQELEATTAAKVKAERAAAAADTEVTALREELASAAQAQDQLAQECATLKRENEASATRTADVIAEATGLKAALQSLQEQVDAARDAQAAAEARARAAAAEAAEAAEAGAALAAGAAAATSGDASGTKVSDGATGANDAPVAPSPLRTTTAAVRRELEATVAQLATVTRELGACRAELASVKQQAAARDATAAEEVQAFRKRVDDAVAAHAAEVQQLQADAAHARKAADDAIQGVSDANTRAAAAQAAATDAAEAARAREQELVRELDECRGRCDKLAADASSRAKSHDLLDMELREARAEVSSLRGVVSQLQEQAAAQEAASSTAQHRELQEATAKWKDAESKLAVAVSGQRAAGDAYRQLQASYDKLQADLRAAYTEAGDRSDRLSAAEERAVAAETQVWELQEELTKAKVVDEQLSSAAGRVEHLDEQLAHAQDQLRRCEADADAAKVQAQQHAAWLQSQVEEAKRDADAARSELDAANERLARLDELEAEAAGLRADLRLRQDDANRGEAAAEKLQRVLERVQAQHDASQKSHAARVADLEAKLAAQTSSSKAEHSHAVQQAVSQTRAQYETELREVETARLHAEALAHKAQQAQASLQRALEESMTRLQSEGGNMIDRRIINKLLVTYFERPQSSKEVLGLMSRMLGFTEEDKARVGLIPKPGGLLSSSLSWLGLSGGEGEGDGGGASPSAGTDGKSITDLWVEFLVNEAEAAAASSGAGGAAEAPPHK